MPDIQRRTLLRGCLLSLSGALTGCPESNPRRPELSFAWIELANRSSDRYTLDVEVDSNVDGNSGGWGIFNNVTLLGFTTTGREVRRKQLGDIEPSVQKGVTLECEQLSPIVTYSAD